MSALIVCNKLSKEYKMGHETVHALREVQLTVNSGDFLAIIGASGSGKSTLMNILGLLERPDSGDLLLEGKKIKELNDNQMAEIRNEWIGFVFQSFNLLPRASALKNVMVPLIYSAHHQRHGLTKNASEARGKDALAKVSLENRMHHKPNELSGGQRQRVAIARALVNNPKLILADEPTGSLDSKTGQEILQLFKDLNQQGVTIILVTHDNFVADQARQVYRMKDGQLTQER